MYDTSSTFLHLNDKNNCSLSPAWMVIYRQELWSRSIMLTTSIQSIQVHQDKISLNLFCVFIFLTKECYWCKSSKDKLSNLMVSFKLKKFLCCRWLITSLHSSEVKILDLILSNHRKNHESNTCNCQYAQ